MNQKEWEDFQFKWIKEYMEKYDSSSVQKSSFDYFIHHRLSKIVEEEHLLDTVLEDNSIYRVKFGQAFADRPYIIDENRNVRFIYPHEARIRELTYSSVISVNIRVSRIKDGIESDVKEYFKVMIARIPMMIGTSKCNLHNKTLEQRKKYGECHGDNGGYFIIKGKERVLVSQERMTHNIVYVFEQKPTNKFLLTAEIRSMSEETGHSVLIQMKICNNNEKKIVLQIPYIMQEIPIGYIFRAFHFEQKELDKIFEMHLGFSNHSYLQQMRQMIQREYDMIESPENAMGYIAQFSIHNMIKDKKNNYIHQILHNELFPHLGVNSSRIQKGMFLAHMMQKLVMTHIGERPYDDRDHINNKRLETSGVLIAELFRILFKRFVRSIQPQLVKRPDIMIVISRLNIITQGIKHCFSTGNWGIPKSSYIRSGVSQILSRLTYNSFLSHLRRILIPIGKEGKNTKIRQIHPSQIGFICAHETPEGHCLTADARILLDDGVDYCLMGNMDKEDGQNIMAVEKKSGRCESSGIYNYFSVIPKKLFYIELCNGYSIRASGKHPFLVLSKNNKGKWVFCENISRNDSLGCILQRKDISNDEKNNTADKDLFSWDVLIQMITSFRFLEENRCIKYLAMLNSLKNRDTCFLTTKWKRLSVYCRLIGLFSVLPRINAYTISIPEHLDVNTILHDLDLCFPNLYAYESGVLTGFLFPILFSQSCLSNIYHKNASCFREFVSGLFSGLDYHPMDYDTFVMNEDGLYIKEYLPIHFEMFRTLQTEWRKNHGIRWDMIHHQEDRTIRLIPSESLEMGDARITDFAETYGKWYCPLTQRKLLLACFYQKNCRNASSFHSFYSECVPDDENVITFLSIKNMKQCEKEIVMDFTTRSNFHAFIANGFVTHNSAGIVKNMTMTVQVSAKIDNTYLRSVLETVEGCQFSFENIQTNEHSYRILLNGNWIGNGHGEDTYNRLIDLREKSVFPHSTSISVNHKEKEILIFGDEGRMIRPLFEKNKLFQHFSSISEYSLKDLLEKRIIVFLDSHEIETKVIAMTLEELQQNASVYDYCEIHPSLIMGLCVSLIPYVDHTQAPRVTYHASMGKQAIGYPFSTNEIRADTVSHILWHPEKPLIKTHYGEISGCDRMATGNNLIVAIAMYTGFNQEDSVLFNQSAIDRGLFRSFCFRNVMIEERKKTTTHIENICPPNPMIQNKSFNYSKLDENGIIKLGVFVGNGDVLVNRIQTKTTKLANGIGEEKIDSSVVVKSGEEGYIDKVFQSITPDGYKIIKIKIRSLKIPEIGDKVASRSAQKGTIGMVFRQEDMPFTTSGISPDLIINPLCIPSRMTINQLIECLGAKSSAFKGKTRYSTAFSSHSTDVVDDLCKELKEIGFERHGYEQMMNGFTGESFSSLIFIGPTYYHRLKHLVSAKIHVRNHGSVQALTRQPLEGRSRDGGLRFGEMERDCMISHGVSRFLTERLFDMSDKFTIPVCGKCGSIPHKINMCNMCDSDDIRTLPLPYACKLLFQELNAMGIQIKMHTK